MPILINLHLKENKEQHASGATTTSFCHRYRQSLYLLYWPIYRQIYRHLHLAFVVCGAIGYVAVNAHGTCCSFQSDDVYGNESIVSTLQGSECVRRVHWSNPCCLVYGQIKE